MDHLNQAETDWGGPTEKKADSVPQKDAAEETQPMSVPRGLANIALALGVAGSGIAFATVYGKNGKHVEAGAGHEPIAPHVEKMNFPATQTIEREAGDVKKNVRIVSGAEEEGQLN